MHIPKDVVRNAVITDSLFSSSIKRAVTVTDRYLLDAKVVGIKLTEQTAESEIIQLEKYFKDSGKCCFVLDPSTEPDNFDKILIKHGYEMDASFDDVWWLLEQDSYKKDVSASNVVELEVIKNIDDLKKLLYGTELSWWYEVFGNCLTHVVKDLKVDLYVGKIGNKV